MAIPASPATFDERRYRLLHVAALMSLFCVGMYAAAFGPVMPFVADDLDVSLDTAGLLLTALFFGSIIASAAVAVALHRSDTRMLTLWGLGAVVAGAIVLGAAPTWSAALAGSAVLGAGDGLIIAALHILMARTSRDVPAAINRLNMFFAVGAVAGPLWAGAMLATTGDRWIVYGGIAAAASVTLLVMLAAGAATHERIAAPDEEFHFSVSRTTWVMGAVLFLYVGAEFGLGSWVSSYARESADAGVLAGAAITAGYWGALLCGRIISQQWFGRGGGTVAILALAIAGAGVSSAVLAASTGNIAIGAAAAFGAGLCMGPIWPSTVSIVAQESGASDATAAVVTLGNAGGLALPWAQGRVLVDAGPAEGVVVTSVLCAVMLLIVAAFAMARRRSGEEMGRRNGMAKRRGS